MSTTGWKPHWIFHRTSEAYSRYRFHDVFGEDTPALVVGEESPSPFQSITAMTSIAVIDGLMDLFYEAILIETII